MIIIFIGAPGSGKGTQSLVFSQELKIPHLSTGDLLRQEVKQQSEIGKKIEDILSTGALIFPEIVNELVEINLKKPECLGGCILDGYPRSLDQAKYLDGLELSQQMKVIYFDIPKDKIIARIIDRYSCADCGKIYNKALNPPKIENVCDDCHGTAFVCRSDDNEKTVLTRLDEFYDHTYPILPFYENKGVLHKINADQAVNQVQNEIRLLAKNY